MRRFYLLLFTLFAVFCGSESEKTYTVTEEDVVRHVVNHASKHAEGIDLSLEFVRTYGELEGTDGNLQFYRPRDCAVDSRGNLYILDAGNYRVQVFAPGGSFLRSLGRQGEGPGEFYSCRAIDIRNDTLYVGQSYDVSVLTLDGKEIGRFPVTYPRYEFFDILPDGNVLTNFPQGRFTPIREQTEKLFVASVYGREGEAVRDFGAYREYGHWYTNLEGNRVAVSSDQSGMYIAYRAQNRIERYSFDGVLRQRIKRPVDFEISYHMIDEENGRKLQRPMPLFTKVADAVFTDRTGRLYVRSFTRPVTGDDEYTADDLRFEVFDADGILLGYVPVPHTFPVVCCGDLLFFIDERDGMCLHEYRIVSG